MLQRLWSSNKSRPDGAGDAPQGGAAAPLGGGAAAAAAAAASQQRDPTEQMRELQRLVEKLKGYHDLARDAIEQAYSQDVSGQQAAAARTYRTALDVLQEGLRLPVPSTGLGAQHSNTGRWRSDMHSWQAAVQGRLQDLEGGAVSSSGRSSSGAARGVAAAGPAAGAQRQQPRPSPRQPAYVGGRGSGALGRQAGAAGGAAARPAGGSKEDQDFDQRVLSEVLDTAPAVAWEDVAGLAGAKQALLEMVILPTWRADLFQGLRAPARGLLLYGPPGNGKTLLAKALAHEARATFFNISAASLTSRWHGDAEKLVRALFRVAARNQPAIIFIDEIDSILSERSSGEHEASRRLKTEFLVQFDGVASGSDRLVVLGATNRPWDLDEAVRRRLPKRIYVPLPDPDARRSMIQHLLKDQRCKLSGRELERIVAATDGYSGSDLAALCKEAAMQALRELGPAIATTPAEAVRPINAADFATAAAAIKPSVGREQLRRFEAWTKEYGMAA